MQEGNYLEEAQMLKDQYTEIEKELKNLRQENMILKQTVEEQIGMSIEDLDYQTMQFRMMRQYVKSSKDDFITYNAFLTSVVDNLEEENTANVQALLESVLEKMSRDAYCLKYILKDHFLPNEVPDHNFALAYRQKLQRYKVKAENRRKQRLENNNI